MRSLLKQLFIPCQYKRYHKSLKNKPFHLLDIGCGNDMPSRAKYYFPHCHYAAVDCTNYYIGTDQEKLIDAFYQVDLSEKGLESVPNESQDIIILSHVLEHLKDPYKIVEEAAQKLKKGGKIYLEFPSYRSLSLPSATGTLNFCDDGTHITMVDPFKVVNALLSQKLKIHKARTRRDGVRLLLSPLFLMNNLLRMLRGQKIKSRGLWDLFGFAHFIYASKDS